MHKLPKNTFNQLKIICDMWLYSLSPCPPSSLKELNVWTVKLKVHIFLNKPKSSLKLDSFKWISQTWASSFSHKPSLNFICSAWLNTCTSICKHLIGLKVRKPTWSTYNFAEILPLRFCVPGTEGNSKHPVIPWKSIYKSSCHHLQNSRILEKNSFSENRWGSYI